MWDMKVQFIKVGELKCNCYLVEKEQQYLLIDPGADYEKILQFIQGKDIVAILITHSHFDHVGCVEQLVQDFGYPVYQKDNLEEGHHQIGNFSFEVIYTFGHTMDCITYYFKEEQIMFTGDFLFSGTIGRCDLVGSDYQEMLKRIHKIKKYDDNILVYPGHGVETKLGREKKNNIYFKELERMIQDES